MWFWIFFGHDHCLLRLFSFYFWLTVFKNAVPRICSIILSHRNLPIQQGPDHLWQFLSDVQLMHRGPHWNFYFSSHLTIKFSTCSDFWNLSHSLYIVVISWKRQTLTGTNVILLALRLFSIFVLFQLYTLLSHTTIYVFFPDSTTSFSLLQAVAQHFTLPKHVVVTCLLSLR